MRFFSIFCSAGGFEGMLTPQFAFSFKGSRAGMETSLTRAITIIALTCFLVVGAAATSILNRDSVPMPRSVAEEAGPAAHPVSNKESKKDRLAVVAYALAAYEPQPQQQPQTPAQAQLQAQAQAAIPDLTASLRHAYASAEPADVGLPKLTETPASLPAAAQPGAPAAPKPKAVAKPAQQKNYALLSDAQIAGIKERLRLTASQEYYWPAVETALRAVARKIHQKRQTDPNATGMPIDPDSEEVQQLKSAAMPLLFQLREDQKNEVRSLARVIGLDKVAAMI
jgi:hypothetical protein